MKAQLFIGLFCLCLVYIGQAQDADGVVSFNLPVRNSLTFNRYALNPTFSFVREQTKFINITNKREWVQFNDNPETYLVSFAGRFAENIGAGIGLFQQNYGVLTTFGGVVNFAYNAQLGRDTNLTFGLNMGAYQSGVNTSNVVTNVPDPSLQNVPSNFLMSVNPGINFGTEFFDFGVAVNNLALYNFSNSELAQDNPNQSIQLHTMYTGYMSNRGFLNDAKFNALLRAEFFEDETIISGLTMLTLPLGVWAQAGYNTVYGASGGLGINITEQIAIEYNFENTVGTLSDFGPSHEITLAYRFKPNRYLDYSNDDEVAGLFSSDKRFKKSRSGKRSSNSETRSVLTQQERAEAVRQAQAEKAARAAALEQRVKDRETAKAQRIAQQKSEREAAEEKAKQEATEQAEIRAAQETAQAAEAKRLAEEKAKQEAEAQKLAEEKARQEAAKQAEIRAAQKAAAVAEAKRLAEEKAKQEAEAQRLAEEKARQEAARQAEIRAAQEAAAAAEAKRLEEENARQEAEAQRLVEEKARQDAAKQAEIRAAQEAAAAAEAKRLEEENARQEAEAQRLAQEAAAEQATKEQTKEVDLINNPKDERGKAMLKLAKSTDATALAQEKLLNALDSLVLVKDTDLKALKRENDLSEQGIAVQPRPFKSITEENNRLMAIKSELDAIIKSRNEQINDLERLYDEVIVGDTLTNDVVMLHYRKKIKRLQAEQVKASETRAAIDTELERIIVATEFERRRRIKRASFDTDEQRYNQDRAMLKTIKSSTPVSKSAYTSSDFDFGEELGNNIKILKNINKADNGYYMIIAVHSNNEKLKDFLTKVVASGEKAVDFFFDVNTNKYYIYSEMHSDINGATEALQSRGSQPYNEKMSIVKIEN